jgi:hypothetical protein
MAQAVSYQSLISVTVFALGSVNVVFVVDKVAMGLVAHAPPTSFPLI